MFRKELPNTSARLKTLDGDTHNPGGYIEGYASVFGNTDLGGDIVQKGAFTKTLKERMPKNAVKMIDSHRVWDGTGAVIGTVIDAKEDDYGLWFKAALSTVQAAQDIRTKLKEGILDALSFGYDVIKSTFDSKTGTSYLQELKLYEVSVVIWGMNPLAGVTDTKSFQEIPSWDLAPLDWKFNPVEALERFKAWVSPEPQDIWGSGEWAKYARGFMWGGGKDFKYLCVDVVDGIPKVPFEAAKHWRDTTLADVSQTQGLEAKLKSLYEKFEQPWDAPVVIPPVPVEASSVILKSFIAQMESKLVQIKCAQPPNYLVASAPDNEGDDATGTDVPSCEDCEFFMESAVATPGLCMAYTYMVQPNGWCSTFTVSAEEATAA